MKHPVNYSGMEILLFKMSVKKSILLDTNICIFFVFFPLLFHALVDVWLVEIVPHDKFHPLLAMLEDQCLKIGFGALYTMWFLFVQCGQIFFSCKQWRIKFSTRSSNSKNVGWIILAIWFKLYKCWRFLKFFVYNSTKMLWIRVP